MPRGSGRRPKPTAIRKLEGNRGKRAFNENEPCPELGAPEMPKLPKEAAAEWKRIVPQLMRLGVLTAVDGKALAGYCYAYARWQQAERDIKRYGLTIREPVLRGGKKTRYVRLKSNPAIRVAHEAMKIMKTFLIEFGMTPGSRTRIATFTPRPPDANENESKPANVEDKYFSGPSKSIQ